VLLLRQGVNSFGNPVAKNFLPQTAQVRGS